MCTRLCHNPAFFGAVILLSFFCARMISLTELKTFHDAKLSLCPGGSVHA